MRKLFYLLLPIYIFLPACQEDEPLLPYALDEAYNCFQNQSWTEEDIETAIIGDWNWVYFSCFSGEMGETEVGQLLLKLKADHQLEIYQDGLLERVDTWEVIPRGSENFELKSTHILPWLNGDIVICGDLLLFFHSYIDGCDNYFERF